MVFILLIFFIVSATFVSLPGIEVTRPMTQCRIPRKKLDPFCHISRKSNFHPGEEIQLKEIPRFIELASKDRKKPVLIQPDEWADAALLAKVILQARNEQLPFPLQPENLNETLLKSLPTDSGINVSPLIDMVFILLIFFIVATSFINDQVSKIQGHGKQLTLEQPPLSFQLPASGQLMQNGAVIGLEEIAPIVQNTRAKANPWFDSGFPRLQSRLATQVMDQAILGGAEQSS